MPTSSGIVVVRGDQEMAKECCLVTTKEDESLTIEAFPGDAVEEEESQGAEPVGVMKELHLTETKMVKVGTEVPEKVAQEITEILKKNVESFATEPTEIVGINPKVASHKLNVIPGSVPKVQKKRRFTEERQKIIADEVNILEAADFIHEVFYPEWVANIVLVKKANGKYRMCVDFTDLNKACPKDSYPLPNIDQLVDSTACYLLYSFVDAAQGYHQIPMEEKDQEKTSFVTDRGTYCYKVMPFGLKNAGATYQRLVNFMFQDQLGRNVEAYVDDIIVKSQLYASLQMKEERLTPTVEEQQVLPVAVLDPWMQPIVAYLADGVLPEGRTEAAKLVRISSVYSIIEGALYRTSVTHPWFKCISLEEGSYVLREIHEGECGAHEGAVTLYRKAMLQGFYWPTMKKDAEEMVKKCDKCQKFGSLIRTPAAHQSTIGSPWPFMIWGVDILGPFAPARGQVKFIVVAVDHFTKWIEVQPMSTITSKKIQKWLSNEVMSRFGTPHALVTDNGKQFDCASFRDFCTELGILLKFSSVAHPQTNGLTEVTNRTILSGIKRG
ncbi:uncharacterized protein LOC130015110 [Mercurialis annua]|uniref:uncharacterized protein LOC130015110 n=1 Tax=Mercurialis annua TaxID=3986 RepID=UPI0024AE3DBB|nr:uncharacterized protein LOC130015110 [Mercurialis annua]